LTVRVTRLLALATALLLGGSRLPAQRPEIRFTTSEAFDAAAIPAYAGSQDVVYAHIDANLPAHLGSLQRWLRQPSISAEHRGITEMAVLLRADLQRIGFREAELVPTSGHPGVWGYYDAGAERTVAIYMMYDVQPVEEADWRSPPFAAALVHSPQGRALMARGATNQKGPQRAFLNALEAILAVHGTLPVNLMIVAEGEEELGSPHFPEVIDRYEARLRTASGVVFPFNAQAASGEVGMFMGVKGIVYFELEATPSVAPRLGASAPYYVFTDRLRLPMVSVGLGFGSGMHAPNEYMVVEPAPGSRVAGLAQVERFYVDMLFALAAGR
jgi:acetylornithine deacetylase/succinyl-diaminopimelate desuccinylase-like protein